MRINSHALPHLKKVICVFLAAVLAIGAVPALSFAENGKSGQFSVQASTLPNVAYRTQDEIKAFAKSHPFDLNAKSTYEKSPSLSSPIAAGKLSSKTLNESLNSLNVMRFIAGLDSNVTLDSTYNEKAQAGSLLLALNTTLSHTPAQPAGVSTALYNSGYDGCQKGNLSAGTNRINPAWSIIAYMNDSDANNINSLGHRRWIINPKMGKAGFGHVKETKTLLSNWSVTYAHDSSNTSASQTNVVWPAQNMPVDYFDKDQAWSVSTGETLNDAQVKVTLTRQSDGKKWSFSKSSSNGFFNVNNGGYGQKGCVIFRPSNLSEIKVGDVFRVQVEGIPSPLDYNVSFFSIQPNYKTQPLVVPEVTQGYSPINLDKQGKLKRDKTFKLKAKGAIGSVTFVRTSSSKYISLMTSGKVIVKKGTPKGVYKLKMVVKAKAANGYQAASVKSTVTVIVGDQKVKLKKSSIKASCKKAKTEKVAVSTTAGKIVSAKNVSSDANSKKIKIKKLSATQISVKIPSTLAKGTYNVTISIKAPKTKVCASVTKKVQLKVKVA